MPQAIERALAVALGGGLLSVMLKLGTQAPDADPVFLTIVVAGGALNLYLVGAVANASLAAPGRSWAWRGVIGAVVALIAQAFSALFGQRAGRLGCAVTHGPVVGRPGRRLRPAAGGSDGNRGRGGP